jgi:hypothetical protein
LGIEPAPPHSPFVSPLRRYARSFPISKIPRRRQAGWPRGASGRSCCYAGLLEKQWTSVDVGDARIDAFKDVGRGERARRRRSSGGAKLPDRHTSEVRGMAVVIGDGGGSPATSYCPSPLVPYPLPSPSISSSCNLGCHAGSFRRPVATPSSFPTARRPPVPPDTLARSRHLHPRDAAVHADVDALRRRISDILAAAFRSPDDFGLECSALA